MRKAGSEVWEICKTWWQFIPGGVLGVLAIVEVIHDAHGKSVWFWGFCAMTALLFATGWRLWNVLKERDQARALLANEDTREGVAYRLDGFRQEYEVLGAEASKIDPLGPLATDTQREWDASANHLSAAVSSELRRGAPEFGAYWRKHPEPRLAFHPFDAYAESVVNLSVTQLRHIAARLRAGHDSP